MLDKNNKNGFTYFHMLSFANFISAFGGGMILGQGANLIDEPYLKGGTVLAFLFGTVLGLLFLQLVTKKISNFFLPFFSIFSALISFILIIFFNHYAHFEKLVGIPAFVFFFLLSSRFAFWFYSRAQRASYLTSHQQSVVGVEIGYYGGIIAGLVIWSLPKLHLAFTHSLIIDACLQICAGLIDISIEEKRKQI